jgi:cytochrome c556
MKRTMMLSLALLVLAASVAAAQVIIRVRRAEPLPAPVPAAPVPKLQAVAETRLLMEGLAQPNYRALEKVLKEKPADAEAWTFTRGQALLLAETGNLLMLRPPRNAGETAWMARATEMRTAATILARNAGKNDLEATRTAILNLANSCNRCHETFRVKVRVGPNAKEPGEGRMTE